MQDQLSEAGFQFDDVWNGNAQANSPHTQSVVAAFATPDGSQPTFHSQRTDNDVWMDSLSAKPPTVASANPGVRPRSSGRRHLQRQFPRLSTLTPSMEERSTLGVGSVF